MHVKVSGSYSRVSQIWAKVSGTWTQMAAAFVKVNPVTISGNLYSWAVNYINLGLTGSYAVNGTILFGQGYGVKNSARWLLKPGNYVMKTNLTLGSWSTWYILGMYGPTYPETYVCCYDGQTVSYPFTGHNHYSGNTTYDIVTPSLGVTYDGDDVDIYIMTNTAGASSTVTINSAVEVFKVS